MLGEVLILSHSILGIGGITEGIVKGECLRWVGSSSFVKFSCLLMCGMGLVM